MVRAHEVQSEGFKKHFDPAANGDRVRDLILSRQETSTDEYSISNDFPPLLTIFSAPNYCDKHNNKGAILRIGQDLEDFHVIQYDCVSICSSLTMSTIVTKSFRWPTRSR